MPKKRFVRKKYGRGWTPGTWQGWLSLVIFLVIYISNLLRLGDLPSKQLSTQVTIQSLVLIALFLALCYWKGEKPKRQRGNSKKTTTDEKEQE